MNDLHRELAPIPGAAWAEIETEAVRTLKIMLAARKVVDFDGPHGWEHSAVNLGRTRSLDKAPAEGVEASTRQVKPLIELCVPFTLDRAELEAIARGADDPNLEPVVEAARRIAIAEDTAIFHGYAAGGIEGIFDAAAGHSLALPGDFSQFPGALAEAMNRLRDAGVDGPYALVLSEICFKELTRTSTGGYPLIQHVRRLLEGPMVWAPGLTGALLVSLRGGDFEMTVGRDHSIGYYDHDARSVRLYLQESLAFRVLAPEAAVPMTMPAAPAG